MNHCEFWKVLFLVISSFYNLALDRIHCKFDLLPCMDLTQNCISWSNSLINEIHYIWEESRLVYIRVQNFAYLHLINFSFEPQRFVTPKLSKTVLVLYIALFKSNINTSNNDYGFCVHHFSPLLFLLLLVTFQYSYVR